MSTNHDDQNDEPVTFTSRMFPRLGLGEMWLTFLRDPDFGQPRRCDTELGTKVLVMGSRQPLLDAAGALIAANDDPATSMVMKDVGSDTLARTAALGRATGLVRTRWSMPSTSARTSGPALASRFPTLRRRYPASTTPIFGATALACLLCPTSYGL